MVSIAHIVSPVVVPESSDLFRAQPITFETMRIARAAAKDVEVSLLSAQYPEDRPMVPADFVATEDLTRSILDITPGAGNRKLPLIADILDRLFRCSRADYLVYTNVDIGLQPHFYSSVARFIEQGYDAFTITRRTIPSQLGEQEELQHIFQAPGRPHPGSDCYVFHRSLLPKFDLGTVCLGVPPIGAALLCNCLCHAKKFGHFKKEHLTFHIGDDGAWKQKVDLARLAVRPAALTLLRKLADAAPDSQRRALIQRHVRFYALTSLPSVLWLESGRNKVARLFGWA